MKKLILAVFFLFPAIAKADPTGPAGTSIRQVMDEGTGLTRREKVNFIGSAITCVDNAGNLRTDCTITAGAGASSLEVYSNVSATRSSPTAAIEIGVGLAAQVSGSTHSFRVDFSSVASRSDIINLRGYDLEPATVTPRFDRGAQFGTLAIATYTASVTNSPYLFVSSVSPPGQFALVVSSSNILTPGTTVAVYMIPGSTPTIQIRVGYGDNAVVISSTNLQLNSRRQLRLGDSDNSNYTGFVSPTVLSTNLMWRLPLSDSAGCWQSDGSGNLSIATCGSGGGTSSLVVGTGTASNFTTLVSSPTSVISFLGSQFQSTVSGTTNFISINPSILGSGGATVNVTPNSVLFSTGGTTISGNGNLTFNSTDYMFTVGWSSSTYLTKKYTYTKFSDAYYDSKYVYDQVSIPEDDGGSYVSTGYLLFASTLTVPSSTSNNAASSSLALTPDAGCPAAYLVAGSGTSGNGGNFTATCFGPQMNGDSSQIGIQTDIPYINSANPLTISKSGGSGSILLVDSDGYYPSDGVILKSPGTVDQLAGLENLVLVLPSTGGAVGDVMAISAISTNEYSLSFQTPTGGGGGGGGGSSTLAVGTGTASNFTNNVTSPTAVLSFLGSQFSSVASGTTNFISLNLSSVTAQGTLVAGSNITLTPGAGTLTIAASGGGSGSSVYNATATAGFPYGLTVSTVVANTSVAVSTPMIVKGASSQSANLQSWLNSSGSEVASVSSDGQFFRVNKQGAPVNIGGMPGDPGTYAGLWLATNDPQYYNYTFLGTPGQTFFNSASSPGVGDIEFRINNGTILSVGVYGVSIGEGSNVAPSYLHRLLITTSDALQKLLVVKATSGQVANLQEWQNSSGIALSSVSASGRGYFTSVDVTGGGIYSSTGVFSGQVDILTGVVPHRVGGNIFTMTTSSTSANTTGEINLVANGTGTITVPAAFWSVGKSIKIKGSGYYSSHSAPGSYTLKIKVGSTVILTTATVNYVASQTNNLFEFSLIFTCRATGSSGLLMGQGSFSVFDTTNGMQILSAVNTSPVSIDLSTSNDISFTWQDSVASSNNTKTLTNFSVGSE